MKCDSTVEKKDKRKLYDHENYLRIKADPVRSAKKRQDDLDSYLRGKTDPERILKRKQYMRDYCSEHRQRRRDITRAWYKRNRDQVSIQKQKISGTASLKRSGMCGLCKSEEKQTQGHHLIPRWLSHDDGEENLIETCRRCHTQRWRCFHVICFWKI